MSLEYGKFSYTIILGNRKGERIGIVEFLQTGYYLTDLDHHDTIDECKEHVRLLNERLGITKEVEDAATYGSLFGWHVPAALPAVKYFGGVAALTGEDEK